MGYNAPTASAQSPSEIAASRINAIVEQEVGDGPVAPKEIARKVEKDIHGVSAEARNQMQRWSKSMVDATKGGTVKKLDEGIGGVATPDGWHMAKETLKVSDGDIVTAEERMKETGNHEKSHIKHNHTAPMQTAANVHNRAALVLGGHSFKTDTEPVEAVTVDNTGKKFVSNGYRKHVDDVSAAAAAAGLTMNDVTNAVNSHDFTKIDDRTRPDSKKPKPGMNPSPVSKAPAFAGKKR
nr:hypothetical protein [uncultured bacterium]